MFLARQSIFLATAKSSFTLSYGGHQHLEILLQNVEHQFQAVKELFHVYELKYYGMDL